MLCKVESLMMILPSAYLASFSTPSSGIITIILCSSLTDTFNNKFRTNYGSYLLLIVSQDTYRLDPVSYRVPMSRT